MVKFNIFCGTPDRLYILWETKDMQQKFDSKSCLGEWGRSNFRSESGRSSTTRDFRCCCQYNTVQQRPCTLNWSSVTGHEKSGNVATYCRRGSGRTALLPPPQNHFHDAREVHPFRQSSITRRADQLRVQCCVPSCVCYQLCSAYIDVNLRLCFTFAFSDPPPPATHYTNAEKLILLSKQQTVTLWLHILNKLCLIADTSCGSIISIFVKLTK